MSQSIQRQRRSKKACTACKKAKATCGNRRPCGRCVRLKRPEECIDLPNLHAVAATDPENFQKLLTLLNMESPAKAAAKKEDVQPVSPPGDEWSTESAGNVAGEKAEADPPEALAVQLIFDNMTLKERLKAAQAELLEVTSVAGAFSLFQRVTNGSDYCLSQWAFPQGILSRYNANFARLAGYTAEELERLSCRNLIRQKATIAQCDAVFMALTTGMATAVNVSQDWRKGDGQVIEVQSMVWLDKAPDGSIRHLMFATTTGGDSPATDGQTQQEALGDALDGQSTILDLETFLGGPTIDIPLMPDFDSV